MAELSGPAGRGTVEYDEGAESASTSALSLLAPRPDVPVVRSRHASGPWWVRRGVAPYLLVGDVVAFGLAAALTRPTHVEHALVLLLYVAIFAVAGLYRSRLTMSLLDDLPHILVAVLVGVAVKLAVLGLLRHEILPGRQILHASVLLLAVLVVRGVGYAVVRGARSAGLVRHRTLVVGAGDVGVRLASSMLERREYGLEPVGFVDRPATSDAFGLPVPYLGDYADLPTLVVDHEIRNVIVAFGEVSEVALVEILGTADRLDVQVFWVPRLFELHNVKRDSDQVWGIPLVRARSAAYRSPWWRTKRIIDVVLAAVSLLALSPLLAVCAVLVRREGPGVIFRQDRVGLDGRMFSVLKFRSMKPVDERESQTNWNIKQDSRVTKVGRFLRSTSLDELPQLWNVLRGEMSLVGPRPERPYFVDQFTGSIPRYAARHRVPVGLTGWAQAHGLRGDTSIEDRARFDNYYIENWTPWLDIKIVIRTVGQVLRRQGG